MRKKARMDQECLSEKMNCFTHDNSHWRTAPLWTDGPFCVCMNANNNTYSCLRTINATHNFLFCEFTTGLITYYNLRIDPFEQWNRAHALNPGELAALRGQLQQLKGCRGARECRTASLLPAVSHVQQSTQEQDTVPPPEQPHQGRRRAKPGITIHSLQCLLKLYKCLIIREM
jgi:extracellular sulfatase Sulf